jgi:hypothetical protein
MSNVVDIQPIERDDSSSSSSGRRSHDESQVEDAASDAQETQARVKLPAIQNSSPSKSQTSRKRSTEKQAPHATKTTSATTTKNAVSAGLNVAIADAMKTTPSVSSLNSAMDASAKRKHHVHGSPLRIQKRQEDDRKGGTTAARDKSASMSRQLLSHAKKGENMGSCVPIETLKKKDDKDEDASSVLADTTYVDDASSGIAFEHTDMHGARIPPLSIADNNAKGPPSGQPRYFIHNENENGNSDDDDIAPLGHTRSHAYRQLSVSMICSFVASYIHIHIYI